MGSEQEADEVVLIKHSIGRRRGVVGILYNEKLDLLEHEGVLGSVGTTLAVFAWPEEEAEGHPGDISDCDISCGSSLGGGVQGLDNANREGPHS